MYYGYGIDLTYIIFVIPAMLLALGAQLMVKSAYNKYSKVYSARRITGEMAARAVLRENDVSGVRIDGIAGEMTDHFDPSSNIIRLSEGVLDRTSIAAVGIAAHEAGHACQYAKGYAPMKLRSAIIPVTKIGSTLSWPLLLIGLFLNSQMLVDIGILFFGTATLFQLVTLPVEFNASRRAIAAIESAGVLSEEELPGAKKVLRAAALTYVAALAVSLAQLLRLLVLFGGRRRRD